MFVLDCFLFGVSLVYVFVCLLVCWFVYVSAGLIPPFLIVCVEEQHGASFCLLVCLVACLVACGLVGFLVGWLLFLAVACCCLFVCWWVVC